MRSILLETIGKENPCYIVTENLRELCPTVKQKVALVNNEIGHVAEAVSKQSVNMWTCFFDTNSKL